MLLSEYQTAVKSLLHDFGLQFYGSPYQLTTQINEARRRLAAEAQCVRVLISQNDFSTTTAQEVYTFSDLNQYVQTTPGVNQILGVNSVAVNQGTLKPVLGWMPWVEFQGKLRAWYNGYQNYPRIFSQYGQGVSGSLYLWPIPSGEYGTDIDTYCLPIDLSTDSDVEAIPQIWADAVKYYAAYLSFLYAQRTQDAGGMLNEYRRLVKEGRSFSTPPAIPSLYWSGYSNED